MKDNFVAIALVVDKSYSMVSIHNETIAGINEFIKTQREAKVGETRMTIAQFSDKYTVSHDFVDIDDIKKINKKTYKPDGYTALVDAIGRTIDDLGVKLSEMKEEDRPSKVIVAVITDGEENSSKEYNADKIREMIKLQEEVYNWEVMFLGAGLDAIGVANSYGISASKSMSYSTDDIGTAFTTMGNAAVRGYTGSLVDFTDEERLANSK